MNERQEREAFLNGIAEKLGRPRRSKVTPPAWETRPSLVGRENTDREAHVRQFTEQLGKLHTRVDRATRASFPDVLSAVLDQFGVKSAVFWDDEQLAACHLPDVLSSCGVEYAAWDQALGKEALRSFAARVDAGITCADVGVAETGTVVLLNGGGRGRAVSLLPPVYIVVLPENRLVPRFADAISYVRQRVSTGLPSCVNFITGPSRTADIEMDLAFGVHGPGKVHVILLGE